MGRKAGERREPNQSLPTSIDPFRRSSRSATLRE